MKGPFRGWAAALLMLASFGALAQYPERPICLLVGVAPGGGTDFVARLVGQKLGEKWGQPVVTDNRTGATGLIALEMTAKAAPDGYTCIVFNIGHLNYASGGSAGVQHLAMELLKREAGLHLVHVPYKGSGPGTVDLLAGQVQAFITNILALHPHANQTVASISSPIVTTPPPSARRSHSLWCRFQRANRLSVGRDVAAIRMPPIPSSRERGAPGFCSPTCSVAVIAVMNRSRTVKAQGLMPSMAPATITVGSVSGRLRTWVVEHR